MSTNALVCRPSGGKNHLSREDIPLPTLHPQGVLARVLAAAQNPTDVKSFDSNRFGDGAMLGCDFCGTVEEVGSDVTRFRQGERVGGFLRGGRNDIPGAYSECVVAEEALCFSVPEEISSEAAATLPLALTTAWLAMFSSYSLGMDRRKGVENHLLIWGGTTSVGQYAIQIARYFGFRFATTCRNRKVVEELGAENVFDYTIPTVVDDIKKTLPGITYVFDCIGSVNSSAQASQAICEGGGTFCTIQPGKVNTEKVVSRVKVTDVVVFTAFLQELKAGKINIKPRSEDRDLAHELYKLLPELLASGSIRPNAVRTVKGGLRGVEAGFQLYRDGAISGEKIVYVLEQ